MSEKKRLECFGTVTCQDACLQCPDNADCGKETVWRAKGLKQQIKEGIAEIKKNTEDMLDLEKSSAKGVNDVVCSLIEKKVVGLLEKALEKAVAGLDYAHFTAYSDISATDRQLHGNVNTVVNLSEAKAIFKRCLGVDT